MQGGPLDHLAKLTGREFPSHDAEIRDSNTCFPLCAQNMEMWGIVLSSGVYENGDRTPFRNLRHEDEMKSKNLKNQGLIHCVHARLQGGGFFSSVLLCLCALVSLTRYCATLRLPALGYTVASFAPAHVALRAAFGRLPGQRPLARVPLSGPRSLPTRLLSAKNSQ